MGLTDAVRDMGTIKRLLTQAEVEARRSGEAEPAPEHLLLAATTLPDGTASRALARVGVSAAQLRTAIDQAHASPLADLGIEIDGSGDTAELRGPLTGVFRSTPQAQQVFQEAVALSKSTKPSRLQGSHVVAAVCDLEHGALTRALTALGVERDRLREAAHGESMAR